MNEIIQSLECDATNGKENFCYISEKRLEAIKKLSTIEDNEFKTLNKGIDDLIEKYNKRFEPKEFYLDVENTMICEFIKELKNLKGE